MQKEILPSHPKEWNNAICNNMGRPRDCHTEWSKSDRGETSMILYVISKREWYKRTYLQNRNRLTNLTNLWLPGAEEDGERIIREFGIDTYTLLYLKCKTDMELLYNKANSARSYVAAWMGGEFRGEWVHISVWLSLSAVHVKLSKYC